MGRAGEAAPSVGHDVIVLSACAAHEELPTSPDLPADLFTACLTSPLRVALSFVRRDGLVALPDELLERRASLGVSAHLAHLGASRRISARPPPQGAWLAVGAAHACRGAQLDLHGGDRRHRVGHSPARPLPPPLPPGQLLAPLPLPQLQLAQRAPLLACASAGHAPRLALPQLSPRAARVCAVRPPPNLLAGAARGARPAAAGHVFVDASRTCHGCVLGARSPAMGRLGPRRRGPARLAVHDTSMTRP